jgi:chemotaxis protein MotB
MSSQQRVLGSVADLMAGLMMVFLFIAIAYMIQIQSSQTSLANQAKEAVAARDAAEQARKQAEASEKQAKESQEAAELSRKAAEASRLEAEEGKKRSDATRAFMSEIAAEYVNSKAALEKSMHGEFDKDLKRWRAELDNGSIRFLEPDILFDTNSAEIKTPFKSVLDDFFPRYLAILTSDKFRQEIEEVRIEGHTSTEWRDSANDQDRYLKNAELSQRRALSVLDHCYLLSASQPHHEWLIKTLRANGLSFASPVKNDKGTIDPERSRRVEFRVITRTTEKIRRILETGDTSSPSK